MTRNEMSHERRSFRIYLSSNVDERKFSARSPAVSLLFSKAPYDMLWRRDPMLTKQIKTDIGTCITIWNWRLFRESGVS